MSAFILDGTRYEIADIGAATLFDLLDLKKQTGLGVKDLERLLADFGTIGDEGDQFATFGDALGSEDHLLAFAALVWLSRRRAGEQHLTVREAADFPLDSIEFESDEDAEPEAEADPSADPS